MFGDSGVFTVNLTVYSVDQCEDVSQSVEITVNASPIAGFFTDTTVVCTDLPIAFNDTSFHDVNITNWYYHFSDQDTLMEFYNQDVYEYTFTDPGFFEVEQFVVHDVTGCRDSVTSFYEVVPHPVADFFADSIVVQLPDTTMEFWNTSSYSIPDSSHWLFSIDPPRGGPYSYAVDNQWDAVGVFPDSGLYYVQLIVDNEIGCPDTMTIEYRVWEQETFFVQNTFTPNGDRRNDVFEINQKGIVGWHQKIYDRWGKLVWETLDVNDFWDGRHRESGMEVPQGAYTYTIDLEWYTGKTFSKVGTITIIR
ncbi:MAG: T9SS type B sorting domain-containing protein [Proteobacteria bacterium]|nr:T9SS type B sorting domain-containing protein [Pseudomonadota bacterium]